MALQDPSGKVIDFQSRRKQRPVSRFGTRGGPAQQAAGQARRKPEPGRGRPAGTSRGPVSWLALSLVAAIVGAVALPRFLDQPGGFSSVADAATPLLANAATRTEARPVVRPPPSEGVSAAFTLCGSGTRLNCVVDGDTFWMSGEKIRIADIDTPELSPARCASEKAKGEAAKRALLSELNAGRFELASYGQNDTDVYGRKLRTVMRNNQSIGDRLIAKGLARPWTGSRRSWCD